ncbi:PREDICTED: major facilitator superfamily domain-containing protein 10-like [Branchiostoma belcheri]|uniref:Major facilitator superfamily domain-containing protein 10-like n=1 Tax=Branchiostoma belcheri TaxID=7741 RepID=A0A6P5ADH5_BRABE|nr:PREDICTED: major facilitator superfamily domain-containing protein 10-like [Branchiostoma belcheri]XP_019641338.1 PREDICTED: major facilitator superfamily domain-containing protein 10-like [Branchiostoma belcheri]
MATKQERSRPESAFQDNVEEGDKNDSRVLLAVFVLLLVDLLAFTVILPLMPSLLDYYGQVDQGGLYGAIQEYVDWFALTLGIPQTRRFNAVLFGGILGSLFSLLQFLSAPLIGALSDVYGRKPLMLLSAVGIACSYSVWAVSYTFGVFVLARVLGGISKGNVSLATAVVADLKSAKSKGHGMAVIGIAFSLGFLVGPSIGAWFSRISDEGHFFSTPALFALTLSICNIVFITFFLPETLPKEKRAKSIGNGLSEASFLINPPSLFSFSAVKNLTKKELESLQSLGSTYFLYLFLFSGLEYTLTFLTHNKFQYTSMQQGRMFLYMGLIMLVTQGGYSRRISPGTEKKIASRGMAILVPSFLLIGAAESTLLFYVGLGLFSFASATVVPCLTAMTSAYGGTDQKGTVMGILRSLGALARALGPVAASTVYWGLGALPCYAMGGLLLFIPVLMLAKVQTTTDKTDE